MKDHNKYCFNNLGPWYYEQQELGFNYRMTDIQAALGISQFKKITEIVEIRNELLKIYKKELVNLPIKFLNIPRNVYSSVHLCIIKLNNEQKDNYKYIFNYLHEKGIKVQLHYLPIHLQPYYRKMGFKEYDFPKAENYAKRSMSIPLFPGLTKKEQAYIVNNLKIIFKMKN